MWMWSSCSRTGRGEKRQATGARCACVGCASSQATLKEYVERKLREQVIDSLIVEEDR